MATDDQFAIAQELIAEMRADATEIDEFEPLDLLDYMAIVGVSFTRSRAAADAYYAHLMPGAADEEFAPRTHASSEPVSEES